MSEQKVVRKRKIVRKPPSRPRYIGDMMMAEATRNGGSQLGSDLIAHALRAAREYVKAKSQGRKVTIAKVCGPLRPKMRGPGLAASFYGQYRILKTAVKCAKRDGYHQGYLHKNYSPDTRIKRYEAKIKKLDTQIEKAQKQGNYIDSKAKERALKRALKYNS